MKIRKVGKPQGFKLVVFQLSDTFPDVNNFESKTKLTK